VPTRLVSLLGWAGSLKFANYLDSLIPQITPKR